MALFLALLLYSPGPHIESVERVDQKLRIKVSEGSVLGNSLEIWSGLPPDADLNVPAETENELHAEIIRRYPTAKLVQQFPGWSEAEMDLPVGDGPFLLVAIRKSMWGMVFDQADITKVVKDGEPYEWKDSGNPIRLLLPLAAVMLLILVGSLTLMAARGRRRLSP